MTRTSAQAAAQVTARRATRVMLGCTAAMAVLATVFGYTITDTTDRDALPPPPAAVVLPLPQEPSGATDSPVPPDESPSGDGGTAPTPVGPSATGPAASDPATTAPDDSAERAGAPTTTPPPAADPPDADPPGRDSVPPPAPPTRTATVAPPPPPRSAPRVVGATSLSGFDSFLDDYCEQRGFRGAVLLNGRRTPETGRWACAKFTDLDTIDVDDACRDTFGGSSRARPTVDGDIRTVRCFDS